MKVALILSAIAVAAALFSGCSSSSPPAFHAPGPPTSTHRHSVRQNDPPRHHKKRHDHHAGGGGTSAPKPHDIVSHYGTATCADWKVSSTTNRKIVTSYFLVRANDPLLKGYELALRTAINTTCAHVAPNIRIAEVARLNIKGLHQTLSGH